MRLAIFGNTYQFRKGAQLERLFALLNSLQAELYIDGEFLSFLRSQLNIYPTVSAVIQSDCFEADVALSVGGDGTFLKTAQRVGGKEIPILGINTGHLGFLADVSSGEMEETLVQILKNYYDVESRTVLQIDTQELFEHNERYALNEIIIAKRDSSSMIKIHVKVNGEYLTTYRADGLIVATPTGSTAYSLSVNGPILTPTLPSIVLTPVASHSLNVRPLVMPDSCRLELTVEGRDQNFLVALDGRSHTFAMNSSFAITKASHCIKVVKRHNHNFYETLRQKLRWGGDVGGNRVDFTDGIPLPPMLKSRYNVGLYDGRLVLT